MRQSYRWGFCSTVGWNTSWFSSGKQTGNVLCWIYSVISCEIIKNLIRKILASHWKQFYFLCLCFVYFQLCFGKNPNSQLNSSVWTSSMELGFLPKAVIQTCRTCYFWCHYPSRSVWRSLSTLWPLTFSFVPVLLLSMANLSRTQWLELAEKGAVLFLK